MYTLIICLLLVGFLAFGFALHLIRQNTEHALVAMRLHAALTKHDQFTAAEAAELNRGRWDGD